MERGGSLGLWVVGTLLGSIVGCGDDSAGTGGGDAATSNSSASASVTSSASSTTGAGGGAPGATVTVTVVDAFDDAPLADVLCALDAPGGERITATTDADGVAELSGVDWSLGTASVTCIGESAASFVGFGEDDAGDIRLLMAASVDPDPTVMVSGTATTTDTGDFVLVSSSAGPGFYQASTPDFAFAVYQDRPFSMFALEFSVAGNPAPHGFGQDFFAWAVTDSDALRDDASIDIDLNRSVAPETASGSIALPASADGPFQTGGAIGYLYVTANDLRYGFANVGFATRSSYDEASERLLFDAEWVPDVLPDDEIATVYILDSGGAQPQASYLVVNGPPTDGDLDEQFLDPPTLVDPPVGVPPVVGSTVAWDPEGEAANVLVITATASPRFWRITWPEGTTEATVPALPETTPAEYFEATRVIGSLQVEDGQANDLLFHRVSVARNLTFMP